MKLFRSLLQDKSKCQAAEVQHGKKTFPVASVKRSSRSLGFHSLNLFPNLALLYSVLHLTRSLILLLALFLVEVHAWLVLQSTGSKALNTADSEAASHDAVAALEYFLVETFTF